MNYGAMFENNFLFSLQSTSFICLKPSLPQGTNLYLAYNFRGPAFLGLQNFVIYFFSGARLTYNQNIKYYCYLNISLNLFFYLFLLLFYYFLNLSFINTFINICVIKSYLSMKNIL